MVRSLFVRHHSVSLIAGILKTFIDSVFLVVKLAYGFIMLVIATIRAARKRISILVCAIVRCMATAETILATAMILNDCHARLFAQ